MMHWLSMIVPFILSVFSWKVKFLTRSGAIAAYIVGALVFDAGITQALQLLVFFFVASIATKIKQTTKDALMPYQPIDKVVLSQPVKQGRDAIQVLATGAIPALCCAMRHISLSFVSIEASHLWDHMYFALLCVNFADTLASELGMLSQQTPMHVLHWHGRFSQAGVDGGITAIGCVASVIGGGIIGWMEGDWQHVIDGSFVGLAGSLLDSVLGATLQSRSKVTQNMDQYGYRIYEHSTLDYHQWEYLNSVVNLSSSVITAIAYCLITYFQIASSIAPIISYGAAVLTLHLSYPFLSKYTIAVLSLMLSASLAFIADIYVWQTIVCWALVAILQRPFFLTPFTSETKSKPI